MYGNISQDTSAKEIKNVCFVVLAVVVVVVVVSQIPIYFTFFDIMNCIGHCGFECVPRWLQAAPVEFGGVIRGDAFTILGMGDLPPLMMESLQWGPINPYGIGVHEFIPYMEIIGV